MICKWPYVIRLIIVSVVYFSSVSLSQAAAVLIPGGGFTGPTAEPAAVGSGPGDDALAIARWDTISFRLFSEPVTVGVVAFHREGIDRVEFSANNGAWVAVTEPTPNPETGVVEYWATLEPSAQDGRVEVRAVVTPNRGIPRVLQGEFLRRYVDSGGIQRSAVQDAYSLVLYSNKNGTLPSGIRYVSPQGNDDTGDGTRGNPFASIGRAFRSLRYSDATGTDKLAGGTVFLESGTHTYFFPGFQAHQSDESNPEKPYVSVAAAPGVDPESVVIGRGYRGAYASNLRLKNLTVDIGACKGSQESCQPLSGKSGVLALENVKVIGMGTNIGHLTMPGWSGIFVGESTIENTQVALNTVELARNVMIRDAGEDSFKFVNTIVNCTVRRITNASEGYHPDVWQYFGDHMSNLIMYGVDAQDVVAQGIGAPQCDNCAFVNVYINNQQTIPGSVLQNLQFAGTHEHTYIKNTCLIGPNNLRVADGFTAHNVVFENTYLSSLDGRVPSENAEVLYRSTPSSCEEAVGHFVSDYGQIFERTAAPGLSPNQLTFDRPVFMSVLSETPGAAIHYSLNGTNPKFVSPVFQSPMLLTKDTRIKAFAHAKPLMPSEVKEFWIKVDWDGAECSNGIKDEFEEGVDCGMACPPCATPPETGTAGPNSPSSGIGFLPFKNAINLSKSETMGIHFGLSSPSNVLVTIINREGHEIKQLFHGTMEARDHTIEWDGKNNAGVTVASGLYAVRLEIGDRTATKKVIVIK